jgi:hypothetical protein
MYRADQARSIVGRAARFLAGAVLTANLVPLRGFAWKAPLPQSAQLARTPLEEARAVLESHCGECHNSTLPTAKTAALRIFDLKEPDFAATMSDAQLSKALGRVEGLGDQEALDRIRKFVTAERQHRRIALQQTKSKRSPTSPAN